MDIEKVMPKEGDLKRRDMTRVCAWCGRPFKKGDRKNFHYRGSRGSKWCCDSCFERMVRPDIVAKIREASENGKKSED